MPSVTSFATLAAIGLLPACSMQAHLRTSKSNTDEPLPHYNETEALLLLKYARVTFCTPWRIEQWECGDMCTAVTAPQKTLFIGSEDGSLSGYVAKLPETNADDGIRCMVAFRGSVNAQNGFADALFWRIAWPNWDGANASICQSCSVFSGMAYSYLAIRQQMWEAISSLRCRVLDFAGHSLGGAMATLASFEARHSADVTVDRVYTFAKMRIGNEAFVREYIAAAKRHNSNPPMWRVVAHRDPVARVPPAYLGYVQEPVEVYYDSSFASYRVCEWFDGAYEDPTCSGGRSVLGSLKSPDSGHNTYLNMSFNQLPEACTDI